MHHLSCSSGDHMCRPSEIIPTLNILSSCPCWPLECLSCVDLEESDWTGLTAVQMLCVGRRRSVCSKKTGFPNMKGAGGGVAVVESGARNDDHGLVGFIKKVRFILGSIGRPWRGIGFSRSNSNIDEDFRRTVGLREHDLGCRWCRHKRHVHVLGSNVEGKLYVNELHV